MVIYFDKDKKMWLENVDLAAGLDYSGTQFTYTVANTINTAIEQNKDWVFVMECPHSYTDYRIKNEGWQVIWSPSRKTMLAFKTTKKGFFKKAALVDTLLDKNNTYIIDVINTIDKTFFDENVETNKKYCYVNYIKYVIPSNVTSKYSIIKYPTEYYITGFSVENTFKASNELTNDAQEEYEYVISKQNAKREAKANINKRFVRGKHYYLRSKTFDGSKTLVKEFECKQIIYTIDNKEVNSVVMKQVSGINNAIFTLTIPDCKKYHIKYEPGLQVFSMLMNWIPKNEKYE